MSENFTSWFIKHPVRPEAPQFKVSEHVRIEHPSSGRAWLGEVVGVRDGEAGSRQEGQVELAILLERKENTYKLAAGSCPSDGLLVKPATPEDTALIQTIVNSAQLPLLANLARMRASAEEKVKGFARTLLEQTWIRDQLQETHHFGSLADLPALNPIGGLLSRYDYVVLQCALLFDAKKRWPGAGLSSGTDIAHLGDELSGLEVCQSWAILLNLGHLFGTFASERALFWQLEADRSLHRDILNRIGCNDKQLQQQCEKELQRSDLHHLFYVLAAWRICKASPAIRATALHLIRAFLDESGDQYMRRLKWMFKFSRQVAYNVIHSCMNAGVRTDVLLEKGIAELTSHELIIFDEHTNEDIPLAPLLKACDAFHADATFASAEAASSVLAHIRAFKKWWRARGEREESNEDRLNDLFLRPADWQEGTPEGTGEDLRHFVRLRLMGEHTEWLSRARSWYEIDWGTANFLISPQPGQKGLICDVYAGPSGLSARTICQITDRLAQESAISWQSDEPTEIQRKLWRSIALFGARLFEDVLQEEFRLRIDPVNAKDGQLNYAILAPTFEIGRARLKKLMLLNSSDEERARELDAIIEMSEKLVDVRRPWLVFLARTRIVGNGRDIAEIDGLWGQFFGDRIDWTLLEVKVKGQAGAAGQLEQKTLSCVRYAYEKPTAETLTNHRIAYAKIPTSHPIAPQ